MEQQRKVFENQIRLHSSFVTKNPTSLTRWLSERIPKGFERFYKNKKSTNTSKQSNEANKNASEKQSKKDAGTKSTEEVSTAKSKSQSSDKSKGSSESPFGSPKGNEPFGALLLMGIIVVAMDAFSSFMSSEITWQEFKTKYLHTGEVEKLTVVNKSYVEIQLRDSSAYDYSTGVGGSTDLHQTDQTTFHDNGNQQNIDPYAYGSSSSQQQSQNQVKQHIKPKLYFNLGSVDNFERQLEAEQRRMGINSDSFIPVHYQSAIKWDSLLMNLSPYILSFGLLFFLMRGSSSMAGSGKSGLGGIFKVGKSTAKKIKKEDIKISFKDVAGVDEPKKEIMEFVEFLKNQKKFTDLGAKIPKGALLVGPPGTGKTLLAKATAGEASVPFYSISGSDFIEMFVGVGPSRVRDLFQEARANAPCIVFIDEIDAVARARGKGMYSGGNDERENTLNQLLVEMDGFNSTEGVVVLAGTNRADILDKAILRPGRFDRQITVDIPDIKGRRDIFKVHLKGLTLNGPIDDFASRMAALTPGFAGAEIANICNEAAIVAARRSASKISFVDFEQATDRVIGGLETNRIMTPEEKKTVAYHEAGHAVAGWFLEHADPLLKVTIVPRGKGSLGYAQYLPKEIALHSKEALIDMMCMALGGRASETLTFDGRITTGASDDLRRVTEIAYAIVQVYGMNERIGNVSFPKDQGGYYQDRKYSEATAEWMDEEVRDIVNQAYERTIELLKGKNEMVKNLAEELLKVETINHGDIIRILGPRPFTNNKAYSEYLEQAWSENDSEEEETNGETQEEKQESDVEDESSEVDTNQDADSKKDSETNGETQEEKQESDVEDESSEVDKESNNLDADNKKDSTPSK